MNWWYTVFITFSFSGIVKTEDILSKINKYFKTDAAETFARKWKLYQKGFENTIGQTLQQQFGQTTMNVYMNRYINPMELSQGYYHTDNQVHLIFVNVGFSEFPYIFNTQVNFPLHSNVLSFEASMSKLIVETNYILFRNKSDIIFSMADQDPYKNSPFLFQQVKTTGDLAISMTGCTLSGVIVATLSGDNVNLGHHQVKLSDCQYDLEISSTGTGAPPVIAKYLPNGEKGSTIETLLMRPLLEDLMPKLQSTLFSNVNTSAIFTNKLFDIREKQDQLFEDTKDYLDGVVRSMNKKSIENNMGTTNLADFTIHWNDVFSAFPDAKSIQLTKMVLVGLDTIYSSHSGGPIQLSGTQIIEQLRFSTLEIIGSIKGRSEDQDYEFALEITDYAVDVTLDSNLNPKFEVLGWRHMDFSCLKLEFLPTQSFVVGYLLRELPKRIISHLNSVYSNKGISQLQHRLYTDEGHIQEEAFDGKNEANSEEILEENKNLDKPSMEIMSAEEFLNTAEGPDQIKLNLVNVEPHVEEQEQEQVKLHHVAAFHHDEENDKVILNDDVNKAGILKLNNVQEQEHVKLLHVAAKPHVPDEGPAKIHHIALQHEETYEHKASKDIARNVNKKKISKIQLVKARATKPNKTMKSGKELNQVTPKTSKLI